MSVTVLKQTSGDYLQFKQHSSQGFIGGKAVAKVTFQHLNNTHLHVDVTFMSEEPKFNEQNERTNNVDVAGYGFQFEVSKLAAFDVKKTLAENLEAAALEMVRAELVTYNPNSTFSVGTIKQL
jgi:hypothetical protein